MTSRYSAPKWAREGTEVVLVHEGCVTNGAAALRMSRAELRAGAGGVDRDEDEEADTDDAGEETCAE